MFDDENVFEVKESDVILNKKIDELLVGEGIKRDKFLDYTCVLLSDNKDVAATGSCYKNTLRCLAVNKKFQGEGLIGRIVSHLKQVQFERGNSHFFAYTKPLSSPSFFPLGFYEIERCSDTLVFMENKKGAFDNYLESLKKFKKTGKISAVVMNANPFTLGHQYLVKTASELSDAVYVFVLSEDVSEFPFDVRMSLVKEGCKDFKNVIVLESGSYIISSATFPSYFLKSDDETTLVHATLDARLFVRIARCMNITKRFVGDEPYSDTTRIYNKVLLSHLSENGIEVSIIPRCKKTDVAISASEVRRRLVIGDYQFVKKVVPSSTLEFIMSSEGNKIVEIMRNKI